MKTKKEYLKLLHQVKWEKGKEIESFLIPAIDIKVDENQTKCEFGLSKFGGNPDLPKTTNWPIADSEPMTFLAQINLTQISEFDVDDLLPKSGMLYFFIANPSEFSLEHKVIYSRESELIKRDFPKELKDDCQFNELKINFESIYTFPSGETLEIASLSDNDQGSYFELDESLFIYENNQILGHPYPMQGDVKPEWACEKLGIEIFSDSYDEQHNEIHDLANNCINLFQFSTENSVPEFDDNFSIYAMGYFGITKKDLKEHNFEKTILIFQN